MYIIYAVYGSAGIVLLFILSLLWNVLKYNKKQERDHSEYRVPPPTADELAVFSEALQIKTVAAEEDSHIDPEPFERYRQFLSIHFPFIYTKLKEIRLSPFAFYIDWYGKNRDLDPVLLYSHFDVVPADDNDWTYPPFSGTVTENQIWGRGALDSKNTMIGSMLALEEMLMQGITPERTVCLAFGGDDEVSGMRGARELARHFEERGRQFAWMLNEGSLIQEDSLRGLRQPAALIGTEETGNVTIKLTCTQHSGHSAEDIIDRAVSRLGKHPFKPRLTPVMKQFFIRQIPYVGLRRKLIFANQGLFKKSLYRLQDKKPGTAPVIRTTMEVSPKQVSEGAGASLHFCLPPGESPEILLKEVKKRIHDDRITISVTGKARGTTPAEPSRLTGQGYLTISRVLAHVAPEAIQLPFTTRAAAASGIFCRICPQIYRFAPVKLNSEQRKLAQNTNERISFKNFSLGLDFYRLLLQSI